MNSGRVKYFTKFQLLKNCSFSHSFYFYVNKIKISVDIVTIVFPSTKIEKRINRINSLAF